MTTRDWLLAGAATVLTPPALGLIAFALLQGTHQAEPVSITERILMGLMAQVVAPGVTIWLILPALLVGNLALRCGWAGWLVAALAPVALIAAVMAIYAFSETGYAPNSYIAPTLFFCASGALHGLILWLAVRLLRSSALAPRED